MDTRPQVHEADYDGINQIFFGQDFHQFTSTNPYLTFLYCLYIKISSSHRSVHSVVGKPGGSKDQGRVFKVLGCSEGDGEPFF
jgi:hypothetical protein